MPQGFVASIGTLKASAQALDAIGLFLTTLTFFFTTPTVWAAQLGGFPALTGHPGEFLLKDVVLLGASVWTLSDALKHR